MTRLPSRRTVALGALASGCATTPSLEGRILLSESVMLSGADPEGRHFAAVRACTYPEANVAWLWCMLLTPDGFWQFASNEIAWRGGAVAATTDAGYRVPSRGANARFSRRGTHASPSGADLSATFYSQPSLGEPGAAVQRARVAIEATFAPLAGFGGLLPGRTESFGRAQFRCRIDGRDVTFEGPAQFHEQPQSEPRFVTPFAFASVWSADTFGTFLQSPGGSGGYMIERGVVLRASGVRATLAPGDLTLDFAAERAPRHLSLELARAYRVPIYDREWRGRFVRGQYGGRTLVGFLNSWMM